MWPFGDKVSDKKLSDLVTGSEGKPSGAYNPRMGQFGSSSGSLSDFLQSIKGRIPSVPSPPNPLTLLGLYPGGVGPMIGAATQGDLLTHHKGFFNSPAVAQADAAAAQAPAASAYNPRMGQYGSAAPAAAPPVQPLDDAPQRGAPQAPPSLPWAGFGGPGLPAQAPAPQAPPQAPAVAQTPPQAVPLLQARPAAAPEAQPDTSFFMRNALSMRDPSTGELIDPSGAQSIRGPDLISKMMTYLHNKA